MRTKKIKIIGTQDYINTSTGELVQMQVQSIEERDFNFSKVWMRDFLMKLEIIGNAKTHIAFWIIDNIDKENQLTFTYRQIAEETKTSSKTVTRTMQILMEANFLKQKNQGCYILNPNIVFKGTQMARLNVLTQYQSLGQTENQPSEEEQLKNLLKSIEALTRQANQLSEKIKTKKDNNTAPAA